MAACTDAAAWGLHKLLGMTVTENLSWGLHTASAASKAQQRLYYLRKLKSGNISRPMMMNFYNCAISSVLTYGFLSVGGDTESIQTRTTRLTNSLYPPPSHGQ
ncbi:hypothetical protein WMY93_028857 [Mugilogobius chulae]|uniref:Alkylated DNA repair protein AlkB homologue 8 N-terminal domain-containing protein n=1 Tax=Mugilogobius chulae TaxID=88201 RepID=A0AAW0MPN8_9GOBI